MFLCSKCHGENEPYHPNCDLDFPMGKSFGSCEACKKARGCVDCHVQEHKIISVKEQKRSEKLEEKNDKQ